MDKKRRFCFFHSADRHNDEVLVYRLSDALLKEGWETVFVVNDNKPDETIHNLKFTGTGREKKKGHFLRTLVAPFQMYKKLRSVDADVYETWCLDQMLTCLLLKIHGKRVVFQLREEHPYTFFGEYGGDNTAKKKEITWKKKLVFHLIWFFMKVTLRRMDYVFATGDDEGQILKEMGVKKYVIHGNFPFVNWDFKLSLDDYLKREDRVIYYGTIYGISCQEFMLEALNHIDGVKYLLAGSFRNNAFYREKLQKMPAWSKVEFVNGFKLSDLPGMLGRSTISNVLRDFFKTHYHQGNVGVIKMFESMEAALPLICPDVPVYRAIWKKYKFGILVDPTNVKQIEDAIRYLVENKEEAYRMGQEGRRAVIEKYSWDIVSKEYAEIIDNVYNV